MPKLKTHKAAQKRFKVTGKGKILRMKVGRSHLRRKKSPRVTRQYCRMLPLDESFRHRIERLIPYGS